MLFAERFTGFSPLRPQGGWAAVCLSPAKLQPPQVSAFMAFFIDWLGETSPPARGEGEQNMTSAHLAEDNTIEKTVAQPDTHPDKQFGILTDGITGAWI